MNQIYQDNFRTVYNKSSLDMSEIPDGTIQTVVTSPPYWGATRLGRRSIGYELSSEYCELIISRNKQMALV